MSTREQAEARADRIRTGLTSLAEDYVQAVLEEDWKTLGYESVTAWRAGEFSGLRFTVEARKQVGRLLADVGKTQRQIARATGVSQKMINNDQKSRDDKVVTSSSPRQQAARDREAARRNRAPSPEVIARQDKILAYLQDVFRDGTTRSDTKVAEEAGLVIGCDRDTVLKDWDILAGRDLIRPRRHGTARKTPAPEQDKGPGRARPRNWNGKSNDMRLRETKAAYRAREKEASRGTYPELVRLSLEISRMCVVLEDYHVWEYSLGDVETDTISDIYDDLISLGEWYDRAVMATQAWLSDGKMREKIAKLREVAGRPPEETASALRLADKLERKYRQVLASRPAS